MQRFCYLSACSIAAQAPPSEFHHINAAEGNKTKIDKLARFATQWENNKNEIEIL